MPDPKKTHEDEDRERRYEKHKVDQERSVGSPGVGGGTGGTADRGVDGGEGIPGSANVPQSGLEEEEEEDRGEDATPTRDPGAR